MSVGPFTARGNRCETIRMIYALFDIILINFDYLYDICFINIAYMCILP